MLTLHQGDRFEGLAEKLRRGASLTPALLSDLLAVDAALALIRIELPGWSLRRLACEEGMWLCSLSRQPSLPVEYDDMAEASHPDIALAILSALLEARSRQAQLLCDRSSREQRSSLGSDAPLYSDDLS